MCIFRYTSASAGSRGETLFKKSFISALFFFQIADLDSGHKNGRVLRYAAGFPQNGLLWGTVFRFCVLCRPVSVCVSCV